ncbi:MAG: MiaB/RimO family radical SAM methylthiotransferase [Coriobacteriia bacterium]|nr:MiaB/RimO family radical SAM methylthiotransferase [Coriobacteriia bacterium]MCL2536967.1 MiaB/RimO family radical SAM methylthiotransferase [Coriobacteriia bacterium]
MISTVAFTTLGCPKNEVDTDLMRAAVERAGYYTQIYDPADASQLEGELPAAIVVNTCSFIQEATEASIEAIFDALNIVTPRSDAGSLHPAVTDGRAGTLALTKVGVKGAGSRPVVIVAGCIVNRYADELAEEMPEVAAFIRVGDCDTLVTTLTTHLPHHAEGPLQRVGESARSYQYLRIADGCDRKCTFCTIPAIRGPYTSRSPEDILDQARRLVAAGTRELVVIAQDIGRYGSDFTADSTLGTPRSDAGSGERGRSPLHELLEQLAVIPGLVRLRLMYLQPEGLTDELLDVMARHEAIVNYLEIPLQHASPRILKAMGRHPRDVAAFPQQLEKARALLPGLTVRTTLIAGFPAETQEEFDQLCTFVEDCQFDYVGVFPYSPEEGTRAAQLPDQLDDATRLERAQIVRDIADGIGWIRSSERVGQTAQVLVEGYSADEGVLIARAAFQTPDIDGIVRIDLGDEAEKLSTEDYLQNWHNRYHEVQFTDTILYDMDAVLVEV